jgi:hypothetical protein
VYNSVHENPQLRGNRQGNEEMRDRCPIRWQPARATLTASVMPEGYFILPLSFRIREVTEIEISDR